VAGRSLAAVPRIMVVVTIVAALMAAGGAAAHADVPSAQTKDLAAEVCEDMVADAVVASTQQSLTTAQTGTWAGRMYTCRYDVPGGALNVRVDVAPSNGRARALFVHRQRSATSRQRLFGIGEAGFQASDGTLVARKDNFVLTVDPTGLPSGVDRDVVAFATTRAIFDCW
jgi:hypothetical protein